MSLRERYSNYNRSGIHILRFQCLILLVSLFSGTYLTAQTTPRDTTYITDVGDTIIIQNGDTVIREVIVDLRYPIENNRYLGDSPHGLGLSNPDNFETEVVYDPVSKTYKLVQKAGQTEVQTSENVGYDQYWENRYKDAKKDYWREKARNENLDNMQIDLGLDEDDQEKEPLIKIDPQGSAELLLGFRTNRHDSPSIPENNRRTTTLDFDQNISLSVTGSIGDYVKLSTNFSTKSNFQFDNQMKLGYTGKEDEIIQKVEAGNVTLPTNSSLIQGSQSLFGVKSKMQFGKLTMTTVLAQQRGENSNIEVRGGAQMKEFEISADGYDVNRHFFLSHYFKDQYDTALSKLPNILSGVNITRVEVWVTNTTIGGGFQESRRVVGFTDLGETDGNIYDQSNVTASQSNRTFPDNNANNLYSRLKNEPAFAGVRNFSNVDASLAGYGYRTGIHFNKIANARLLSPSDYTVHPQLGFISLKRTLQQDQILGIAFQYTVGDSIYQVGEFSNDGGSAEEALFVKLIKSNEVNLTTIPLWDLMMKNVYAIGSYGINRESFQMNILYRNPSTGNDINYMIEEPLKEELWVEIMNADQLNMNQDAFPDGIFDFIEGVTINSQEGRIYFPVREPFGSHLRKKIQGQPANPEHIFTANKYAFDSLYTQTQYNARLNFPDKNRFRIKGQYKSKNGSEILLNAISIPRGSVNVTAGGVKLTENVDYTVDYNMGRVNIINQALLNSGTPINISLESNQTFGIQPRSLVGTALEYKVSDELSVGGTLLRLTEKPITYKVNMGDEPVANTVYGLNGTYRAEAPYLTRFIDKLPLLSTKSKSSITANAEFAQLIPGVSRAIRDDDSKGFSYVDDFEGTQSAIDLKMQSAWKLASVPQGMTDLFPEGNNIATGKDRSSGYNRAKMSWYRMDLMFTDPQNTQGVNIPNKDDFIDNHYMRQVSENEIFPEKNTIGGQGAITSMFNLAYFPSKRGPYNYNVFPEGTFAGMNSQGDLLEPETRWGGLMRRIETMDFDASNIEYLEFWVMYPFHEDNQAFAGPSPSNEGGDLYIHLGNISEDILRDGEMSFESGLPHDGRPDAPLVETAWGRVPLSENTVNSFDIDENNRIQQDVGYDGLSDEAEQEFFKEDFLLDAENRLTEQAFNILRQDPSGDNFTHYRSESFGANDNTVDRYLNYTGIEGNSKPISLSANGIPESNTNEPDIEDLNRDNMSQGTESYYQYRISIRPGDTIVGQNHLIQVKEGVSQSVLDNKVTRRVKWLQYRIPIRRPDRNVGNMAGYNSMKAIRMVMKGFEEPTVMRFARLQFLRGDWRKYQYSLLEDGDYEIGDDFGGTVFNVDAVSFEEHSTREPIPYVLPPGITRENTLNQGFTQQINEQSLSLKVENLAEGDSRAAYKNTSVDMLSYNRLKMFVHAEAMHNEEIYEDGDLQFFIRLGADFEDNFYEYELPLKFTEHGSTFPEDVWPKENELDLSFSVFNQIKNDRQRGNLASNKIYSIPDPNYPNNRVSIKGFPNFADVRVIMVGVRNKKGSGEEISAEIWVNELRLTDFDENGGWAARTSVSAKLADFGKISLAGSMSTPGYGSIDKKVSERNRETTQQFDASGNFELGKFIPEKVNMQIPMYLTYSKGTVDPQFNPLDPDQLVKYDEWTREVSKEYSDSIRNTIQDVTITKGINLTNVKKNRSPGGKKKAQIYDIENFTATFSYNNTESRNINTEYNVLKNYKGGLNYNYNRRPKNYKPFRNTPVLKGLRENILDGYDEKIKAQRDSLNNVRKRDRNDPNIKLIEEELKELREKKKSFTQWSSKFLRSPYLKPIKEFNFYLLPSRLSARGEMNRMYNEVKARNTIPNTELLIKPTFNKNFFFNRNYDIKYDLSKGIKVDFKSGTQARIDEPQGRIDTEEEKDSIWTNIRNMGRITDYNQSLNLSYKLPFNQFPLLNWVNSDIKYSGNYKWIAAPLSVDSLGNTIQNSNSIQFNGRLNLVNFYNKIDYLKKINRKTSGRRKTPPTKPRQIGKNPDAEQKGDDDKKKQKDKSQNLTPVEFVFRTIMFVRKASFSYTQNNGSQVEGYLPGTKYLGMDSDLTAPGWDYVFGKQIDDITLRAAKHGWITKDSLFNKPYTRSFQENFTARATLEPMRDLKIDLNASRNYALNTSYVFKYSSSKPGFDNYSNVESGNFSISTLTIKSAFMGENGADQLFEQFLNRRIEIAKRLADDREAGSSAITDTTSFPVGYGKESFDVLYHSFVSTYTGQSANNASLEKFIKIPIPNWKITYDGLSKMPALKGIFKNFRIGHTYRSTLNIGQFQLDPLFEPRSSNPEEMHTNVIDSAGNYRSKYLIDGVSISEKFSPLVEFDMTFTNSLMAKVEINKERSLSMNFPTKKMTESNRDELVIGAGYKFPDVELKFLKIKGKPARSDIDVRADFSIRKNTQYLRDMLNDKKPINGQTAYSLRITGDYILTQKINLQGYYEWQFNEPLTFSYPTGSSRGGISVRVSL